MGKALRLAIGPRSLHLGQLIQEGAEDFSTLKRRDQMRLYESPYHLEGLVPEEEIEDFELELALEGYFGRREQFMAAGKFAKQKTVERIIQDA